MGIYRYELGKSKSGQIEGYCVFFGFENDEIMNKWDSRDCWVEMLCGKMTCEPPKFVQVDA
jgi:hypothetical protein